MLVAFRALLFVAGPDAVEATSPADRVPGRGWPLAGALRVRVCRRRWCPQRPCALRAVLRRPASPSSNLFVDFFLSAPPAAVILGGRVCVFLNLGGAASPWRTWSRTWSMAAKRRAALR